MSIGACPIGAFPIGAMCLGSISAVGAPAGGIDWENWALPPGFRRILDTTGIDLRANREALLNQARREIGLLKDDEPPLPVEIAAVPAEVRIPNQVEPSIPQVEPFDREAFIADFVAQILAEARIAEVERREWLEQDDENVLILVAALA